MPERFDPPIPLPFKGARALRWLLVVGWMAVIFMASADTASGDHSGAMVRTVFGLLGLDATPERLALVGHLFRKASHFTEYAILALLWAWALPPGRYRLMLAWAAATAYAATDEWHQAFVPGRGPALTDVGIDSLGAATALLASWLWRRLRRY
ncbi:VanZ family protein [bacterium]|nr:VanZ family protein [bacterium]